MKDLSLLVRHYLKGQGGVSKLLGFGSVMTEKFFKKSRFVFRDISFNITHGVILLVL